MAGKICTGFSAGQGKIEAQLGKADAAKCFAIAEEAKQLIIDRINDHKIDCDLTWGYLHCIPKAHQMGELHAWKEEWDALGYRDTQVLSKAELEEKLGTRIYHGALREGGAGHFHPLNYCLGLARAATKPAPSIYENSPVDRHRHRHRTLGAHGAGQGDGEVHGDRRQCLSRAHRAEALWPRHAGRRATSSRPNPWARIARAH